MNWVAAVSIVSVLYPVMADAQEVKSHFDGKYLCIEKTAQVPSAPSGGVLDMLKFVNDVLDHAYTLTITGKEAVIDPDIGEWFPVGNFKVVAAVNDVVIMERAYLGDAGPGCDAFADLSGFQVFPECKDWTYRPMDAESYSSKELRLVWERLIFRRKALHMETIFSGDKGPKVKEFECDDFDAVARYLKR